MECRLVSGPNGMIRLDRFDGSSDDVVFLSHLHSDHTAGLRSFTGVVYTTEFNAQFIECKGDVIPAKWNTWFRIPKGWAAAVPSGHCKGAAMWALKFDHGHRLLYSGDWKWYPGITQNPVLQQLRGLDLFLSDETLIHTQVTKDVRPFDIEQWFKRHPGGVVENRTLGLETLQGIAFTPIGPHRPEVKAAHRGRGKYPMVARARPDVPVLRLSATWYVRHMPAEEGRISRKFFRTHANRDEHDRLVAFLKPKQITECSGNVGDKALNR